MRIVRSLALAAAIVAALAAWPQQNALPPTADHSQHRVVNTPTGEPIPSLIVRLFPDGMDGYNLYLETRNYRFTPENVGQEVVANEGHAHLYLNGAKVARLYSPWRHLPRALFQDGINRVQVELNANDHSTWGVAGEPIGADVLIDASRIDRDPILREEVRYTLDWDWGSARPHTGGGWMVETDMGYFVHVTAGKAVTRGLELLPCHTMPMPSPTAWLSPATAYAGHGSLLPNESKISESYVEDLAEPEARFLESRVVTDPEYCQAHYLIARPRGTGPGTPSVELTGKWSRSSKGPWTEIRISSSTPYGEIHEILDRDAKTPTKCSIVGGVDVTVLRRLDSLFDGIDFAFAAPETLGPRVARSLVSHTKVSCGLEVARVR